jgi:sugar phosphate isomerase/epimerase
MGLVMYCCSLQRQAARSHNPARELFEPRAFLKHCQDLGAGGMQIALGVREPAECHELRRRLEQAGMYLEAIVSAPEAGADEERFAAEIRTAADCGALAARTTIIPGRRYEYFDSLAKFVEFAERGRQAVLRAVPIMERYRLPLAIENHKDQRLEERVALLREVDSPFIGACVDTGNSLALLEDPLETVRALTPWAHSVHLKDQAVQPYADGFLLGDVPLGGGCLPLKEMVQHLQRERPAIKFSLELITRDPLRVPVLAPHYWTTMPNVPAAELARRLRWVRDHAAEKLVRVSELDFDAQVQWEQEQVRRSIEFARNQLALVSRPAE